MANSPPLTENEVRYQNAALADENRKFLAALTDIKIEMERPGGRPAHLKRVCALALRDAGISAGEAAARDGQSPPPKEK